MKILSISDKVIPFIYSTKVKQKFGHIDFVIACGDLPYYYQEFIISALNIPLFFVRGNHDPEIEYRENESTKHPLGGIDLHRKMIHHNGAIIAGIEGSIRYKKEGRFQYTQSQMWTNVLWLLPALFYNRVLHGRFVDIFVTHAPPWKIHDREDKPHQGIKAFRWFLTVFKPRVHFHGHIHVYRPDAVVTTQFMDTKVINTYGYLETNIAIDH